MRYSSCSISGVRMKIRSALTEEREIDDDDVRVLPSYVYICVCISLMFLCRSRRRERKLAGRIKLKPVGSDDPDAMVLNQHAAMEKRLMRVATKGVVQLFNAVTKLQRQSEDAQKERKGGGGGGGGASTTTTNNKTSKKFSFISELRKLSTDNGDTDTDGKPEARDATADATVARRREDDEDDDEGAPGASTGWEVLQDGFGTGATKLKDWDRDDGGIAENSIKNKATNKKKNKKKGDAGPSPVDDGVLEDYFEDSSSDDESG